MKSTHPMIAINSSECRNGSLPLRQQRLTLRDGARNFQIETHNMKQPMMLDNLDVGGISTWRRLPQEAGTNMQEMTAFGRSSSKLAWTHDCINAMVAIFECIELATSAHAFLFLDKF